MVFVVTGLAGSVAAAGAAGAGGTTGAAVTAEASVARSLSARTTQGKRAARQGRHSEAWLRMGLRSLDRQIRSDPGCVAHATGKVRKCLRLEPCTGLQRSLTTLTDAHGNTVRVSIAWVRMPTRTSARHFQNLIDRSGTGSITPLDARVRLIGRHYASRRSGTVVVTAEAIVGSGRPTAELLNAVSEVAAEFPGPGGN